MSADVVAVPARSERSIPDGTAVLFLSGDPIDDRTDERLEAALAALPGGTRTVVLRLASRGGTQRATASIVERLKKLSAAGIRLRTLVHQGDACASACILIFMQGQDRYAGNASAWGFHGACHPGTNIPSPSATALFIDDLVASGVARDFVAFLRRNGCMVDPGVLWLSGYELKTGHDAGIVTHLVPAWQPEFPVAPVPDPALGPH